jgi:hypothetical protein
VWADPVDRCEPRRGVPVRPELARDRGLRAVGLLTAAVAGGAVIGTGTIAGLLGLGRPARRDVGRPGPDRRHAATDPVGRPAAGTVH